MTKSLTDANIEANRQLYDMAANKIFKLSDVKQYLKGKLHRSEQLREDLLTDLANFRAECDKINAEKQNLCAGNEKGKRQLIRLQNMNRELKSHASSLQSSIDELQAQNTQLQAQTHNF